MKQCAGRSGSLQMAAWLKPVPSVINGETGLPGKARGVDSSKPVLLGYSSIPDALLLKYIADSRHCREGQPREAHHTTVGSVIGTHAKSGAIVVAFFKNGDSNVDTQI